MKFPVEVRDDYVRPTPFEAATCWMYGLMPAEPTPVVTSTPRFALECVIERHMQRGPCFVAFSGGRDSSAVLAVAALVARRLGLPDPVPVTEVYPGAADADEATWQEAVISHLRIRQWIRISVTDGADLLGDSARASLLARGLVWPPAIHVQGALYAQARGGVLMTGEGGDEVLGPRRITPAALLARYRRRPVPSLLKAAARAAAPRPVRQRHLRSGIAHQGWLRPTVRQRHASLLAEECSAEPWSWREAVWWLNRRRASAVVGHNAGLAAKEHGVDAVDPLLDREFLAAWAAYGGYWGFEGRTAIMRKLFSDLLPDSILSRTSKASFNQVHFGSSSKEFARAFDGTGVDEEIVHPDALRQEWLSSRPSGSTGLLLQQAWLAQQGEGPKQM